MKMLLSVLNLLGTLSGVSALEVPKPQQAPPVVVISVEKDYAAAVNAVNAGQTVILTVGMVPKPGDYYEASHTKILSGRYKCWRDESGIPRMVEIVEMIKQRPLILQRN